MADIDALPNGDHSPTYVPMKSDQFIEAAGLQRSGTSGRKSSVEKLLEQSLNTSEVSDSNDVSYSTSFTSPVSNVSSDSDDNDGARRSGRVSAEKPANLKSDEFIKDAGLSRTGQVPRKSSMERLLEDQLQTSDNTCSSHYDDENGDRYLIRKASPTSDTPTPEETSNVEGRRSSKSGRKSSVYEQKQIEAPVAVKGNRISSRTENLFKQYERDMTVHEPRPITNVNEGESFSVVKANYNDAISDEKRKVDITREEKEQELREMRAQYQQRLAFEEQQEAEERAKRIANEELKSVRRLGDIKNKYLSVAAGQSRQTDSVEEEEKEHVDKFGGKIEKGGGQIEVVASADGVNNIRERFGSISKAGWKKKQTEEADTNQVDSQKVNSARNLFKQFESNRDSSEKRSFNRPTSRKVKNPKELMEMRKKITYGGDNEELPQDGVVNKSVILDDNELGKSPKKESLSVYKNLENSKEERTFIEKPKNRLLSDGEARANMEVKKIENSDCGGDNAADVSGYDTGTPCSPTSTASDGYSSLSDTKDVSQSDDLDLTDPKLSVNQQVSVSLDVSHEDTSVEVEESEDVYENVHLV